MIDASHQRNVIPALCEITVDCRLLPETTPADVEPLIRAALGDGSYELEFLEAVGGTRSPLATPLWDALERFTTEIEPGARMAPVACPGFTDSHFLRQAFGTTAYGYFPMKTMDTELAATLIHSANERIPRGRPRARRRHAALGRAVAPRRMTGAADALVVFGITGDLARPEHASRALLALAARAAHLPGDRRGAPTRVATTS